jgi:hypothetical protein
MLYLRLRGTTEYGCDADPSAPQGTHLSRFHHGRLTLWVGLREKLHLFAQLPARTIHSGLRRFR